MPPCRAAIASGMCETVLITHGESGRSGVGRTRNVVAPTSLAGQFEQPYGPRAAGPAGRPRGADFVHDPGVALHEDFRHPRESARACTHLAAKVSLSALGGGEGRGEVGEPARSQRRHGPPHPPAATAPGSSLSPRKRAERGKGSR